MWSRVPGESFGRPGDHRIENERIRRTLVAVGSERSGGATDPAVWHSEDRAQRGSRPLVTSGLHQVGQQAAMQAVVGYNPGLVAVGFQRSKRTSTPRSGPRRTGRIGAGYAAFVRRAGRPADARRDHARRPAGGGRSRIGNGRPGRRRVGGVRWTLVAGTRSDTLGGPGDQQMLAVVAGGPGLIAVGSDTSSGRSAAAVWTSTDGRSWDQVPTADIGAAGEGNQSMSAVTPLDGWFVAGGWSDASGDAADGAIWLSADGVHWTNQASTSTGALAGPGRQQIDALTAFGPDELLAGGSAEPGTTQGRSGSRRSCSPPRRRPPPLPRGSRPRKRRCSPVQSRVILRVPPRSAFSRFDLSAERRCDEHGRAR